MILWVILFALIVAISFLLAYLSMRDFHAVPETEKVEYGLFLIRNTAQFTNDTLHTIRQAMLKNSFIISIERLFKGNKSALTIFGPKDILNQFVSDLNLLELEDYTLDLNTKHIAIWEVGVKYAASVKLKNVEEFFKNFPLLEQEDQFLWQIILTAKGNVSSFQSQIRAAVYSKESMRRKTLAPILQSLGVGELVKIPRPFSAEQMMNFYQLRSLSQDSQGPILEPEQVLGLLKV